MTAGGPGEAGPGPRSWREAGAGSQGKEHLLLHEFLCIVLLVDNEAPDTDPKYGILGSYLR